MDKTKGFTLIELIATLSIVAILLTIGVPSFLTIIQNNRMTTNLNDFVTDLNLARSEAVKRGIRVSICKSADQASCTNTGDWSQGWIVFADPNNDALFTAETDELLRVHQGLSGNETTLIGNLFVSNYISYGGSGFTQTRNSNGFQAGTLVICDDRGYDQYAKHIVINRTGRINTLSVNELSNSDRRDCNASGDDNDDEA